MPPPAPAPSAEEKPLVLLAQPLFPNFAAALEGRHRFVLAADAGEAAAAEARVLLVPGLVKVTAELIGRLPALELVVATSVGVDHVDLDACRRRGLAVTNAGGAFSVDSADFAVGLVVAVLRRVAAAEAYVRRGGWAAHGDYPLATKMSGRRVGIVGLGQIGSLVARRLAAFGCAVAYHSRSPKPAAPYAFFPSVGALAASSDVLVLSCALTEETRRVVNREVMEALGAGGVLVNVGRGGLVDEPELVRCLEEGVIGGAGLDVYDREPEVPPELFEMDNVVLSDHRAVLTPESIAAALDVVAGNLEAGVLRREAAAQPRRALTDPSLLSIGTYHACMMLLATSTAINVVQARIKLHSAQRHLILSAVQVQCSVLLCYLDLYRIISTNHRMIDFPRNVLIRIARTTGKQSYHTHTRTYVARVSAEGSIHRLPFCICAGTGRRGQRHRRSVELATKQSRAGTTSRSRSATPS